MELYVNLQKDNYFLRKEKIHDQLMQLFDTGLLMSLEIFSFQNKIKIFANTKNLVLYVELQQHISDNHDCKLLTELLTT